MPRLDFRDRLRRRASRQTITLAETSLDQLEAFYELLSKWNERINLTALPLKPLTDEALDRLFIEPLIAARHFPDGRQRWFDLGSGGGSPAIPLKVARPETSLTMVESKTRKVAFLREAVRTLGLAEAVVEASRFQELPITTTRTADIITVRAVRFDGQLRSTVNRLLKSGGRMMLFSGSDSTKTIDHYHLAELVPLPGGSQLSVLTPVPRGT